MFTESDLRELLGYQPLSPVLSVYLNTEPSEGNPDAHKRRLRSLLKEAASPEDASIVERYISHEFGWSGRSLVIFSSAPESFFRAYSLAIPLRSRVRVSNHPHVKPLADLLDSYGGYGVALVDKQGARMFFFHLGELREQEGVLGESVRHTKRGGGSQAQGRRGGSAGQTNYVEEVTERNIKEAAEFAAHFFAENNVRRILLGGTDENVALFRTQLPKTWQSLVVGSFPMSMTASHGEVLDRAMQVGQEADRRREARLVETVVTNAAKGQSAVVGLEETLLDVHHGRVQTLVIKEGLRAAGKRCQGCGSITTKEFATCPVCGGTFDQIPDVVELAVREVMQTGGDVEFLHDETELEKHESFGAILRY
jgi:peptide subunit release factor 1 (eRF1)